MRIVLDLPDDELEDIRIEAEGLGMRLDDLVADYLREGLQARRAVQATESLAD